MGTGLLAPIDTKPIENTLALLDERATSIQVRDGESYALACQIALDGRKEIKAIGFVLDPGINSARDHLDMLRNQKAAFVNRITPSIELASRKAEEWKAEERRKATAEEERINQQRRAEAAQKAELERKAAEAQAKQDREQRERELAEARKAGEIGKREEARLAKAAAEAEAAAKKLAAKQAAETAANVQDVTVAPSVPKVAGIRARVNWKFRIVDVNKIPRQYMQPNEVSIGYFVRETKQAGEVIPGIEAYSEDSI